MKRRPAVQVHLIRALQLPCNSVGFQKQKKCESGRPAQFCCKFVSSSIEFIVCTSQGRNARMCFGCSFDGLC